MDRKISQCFDCYERQLSQAQNVEALHDAITRASRDPLICQADYDILYAVCARRLGFLLCEVDA